MIQMLQIYVSKIALRQESKLSNILPVITSAIDPIDNANFDFTILLIIVGKALAVFVILLIGVMLYIWAMRKVIADMQNRIGPSSAGPFGVL